MFDIKDSIVRYDMLRPYEKEAFKEMYIGKFNQALDKGSLINPHDFKSENDWENAYLQEKWESAGLDMKDFNSIKDNRTKRNMLRIEDFKAGLSDTERNEIDKNKDRLLQDHKFLTELAYTDADKYFDKFNTNGNLSALNSKQKALLLRDKDFYFDKEINDAKNLVESEKKTKHLAPSEVVLAGMVGASIGGLTGAGVVGGAYASYRIGKKMLKDTEDYEKEQQELGNLGSAYDDKYTNFLKKVKDISKETKASRNGRLEWADIGRGASQIWSYIHSNNFSKTSDLHYIDDIKEKSDNLAQDYINQMNAELERNIDVDAKWQKRYRELLNSGTRNDYWEEIMDNTQYGKALKNTDLMNTTAISRARDIVKYEQILERTHGNLQMAMNAMDAQLQHTAYENQSTMDKAKAIGSNIAFQFIGGIGELALGIAQLTMRGEEAQLFNQGLWRDSDGKIKRVNDWFNKNLWSNMAKYGTVLPDKIDLIHFGIGSEEYNREFQNFVRERQKYKTNDLSQQEINELEQEFQAQWIHEAYQTGEFKGLQIAENTIMRDGSESDFTSFFNDAIGMSGQIITDAILALATGGAGTLVKRGVTSAVKRAVTAQVARKAGAIAAKSAKVRLAGIKAGRGVDKIKGVLQKGIPAYRVGEAYAKGVYDESIINNTESVRKWLDSNEGQEQYNQWHNNLSIEDKLSHAERVLSSYDNNYKGSLESRFNSPEEQKKLKKYFDGLSNEEQSKIQAEIDKQYQIREGEYKEKGITKQQLGQDILKKLYFENETVKDSSFSKNEFMKNDEGIQDNLQRQAMKSYHLSKTIESIRYYGFNSVARQYIFGDANKRIRGLKDKGVKIKGQDVNNRYFTSNGKLSSSTKSKIKDTAKEILNSGWTNYADELTSGFSLGVGYGAMNDYLRLRTMQNETLNTIMSNEWYGFARNFDEGIEQMNKRGGTKDSAHAFLVGALGSVFGINAIKPIQTIAKNGFKGITEGVARDRQLTPYEIRERFNKHLGDASSLYLSPTEQREQWELAGNEDLRVGRFVSFMSNYMGSSLFGTIENAHIKYADAERYARGLQKLLDQNTEVLKKYNDINTFMNVIQEREAAIDGGNIFLEKNIQSMQAHLILNTLTDMERLGLQDTDIYKETIAKWEQYAKGDISIDDINEFIQNPNSKGRLREGLSEEEQANYIKDTIQKNAQRFLRFREDYAKTKEELKSVFTDLEYLTPEQMEVYDAALLNNSMLKDVDRRQGEIEKEIHDGELNTNSDNRVRALMEKNEFRKNIGTGMIAQMEKGIEERKQIIKDKKAEREKIQKAKENKEEDVYNLVVGIDGAINTAESEIAWMEQRIKTIKSELKADAEALEANDISQISMTAEEILALNPRERNFMLSSENQKFINDKLKKEIKRAKEILKEKGEDWENKIIDSAHLMDLKERMQDFKDKVEYDTDGLRYSFASLWNLRNNQNSAVAFYNKIGEVVNDCATNGLTYAHLLEMSKYISTRDDSFVDSLLAFNRQLEVQREYTKDGKMKAMYKNLMDALPPFMSFIKLLQDKYEEANENKDLNNGYLFLSSFLDDIITNGIIVEEGKQTIELFKDRYPEKEYEEIIDKLVGEMNANLNNYLTAQQIEKKVTTQEIEEAKEETENGKKKVGEGDEDKQEDKQEDNQDDKKKNKQKEENKEIEEKQEKGDSSDMETVNEKETEEITPETPIPPVADIKGKTNGEIEQAKKIQKIEDKTREQIEENENEKNKLNEQIENEQAKQDKANEEKNQINDQLQQRVQELNELQGQKEQFKEIETQEFVSDVVANQINAGSGEETAILLTNEEAKKEINGDKGDIDFLAQEARGGQGKWNVLPEVEQEMEAIKAQAITDGRIILKEDGTFDYALAPNGNKSNAENEKEWLQVRTKNFIKWAGNWELGAKVVNIIEAIKEHGFKNFAEAKQWAKENIVGTINHSEIGNINISSTAIDKYLSEKASTKSDNLDVHLSALRVLPKIIEESIVGEIYNDRNNNKDIKDIVRLFGAINIDGKTYRVKTTVKRYTDVNSKSKAYSYEVTEVELLDGQRVDAQSTSSLNSNNSTISGANLLKNVKKTNSNENILNYTVAVDENGEPLKVYHTVNDKTVIAGKAQFTTFSREENNGRLFFFTDNKKMSASYMKRRPTFETLKDVQEQIEEIKAKIDSTKTYLDHLRNPKKDIENRAQRANMTFDEYLNDLGFDSLEGFIEQNANEKIIKEQEDYIEKQVAEINRLEQLSEKDLIATRSFYVKLSNPKIINANDSNWNDIVLENTSREELDYKKKYEKDKDNYKDQLIKQYAEKRNPQAFAQWEKYGVGFGGAEPFDMLYDSDVEAIDKEIKEKFPNDYSQDLYEATTVGIEDSINNDTSILDGFIVKNVYDYGPGASFTPKDQLTSGTVFAIRNPNQIKSATDNVGTFSTENDRIDYYRTPDGEIYGFTKNGKSYFIKDKFRPEVAVHEYTHLWAQAVRVNNPELWDSIKKALANSEVAKAIAIELNDSKFYDYLKNDKDRFIEEVLATFSGREGQKLIDNAQKYDKEKMQNKSIWDKIRHYMERFWKWVGVNLFDMKEVKDVNEVVDRVLYDFVNLTNLKTGKTRKEESQELSQRIKEKENQISELEQQLKQKDNEINEYKKQIEKLNKEIEKLSKKVTNLQAQAEEELKKSFQEKGIDTTPAIESTETKVIQNTIRKKVVFTNTVSSNWTHKFVEIKGNETEDYDLTFTTNEEANKEKENAIGKEYLNFLDKNSYYLHDIIDEELPDILELIKKQNVKVHLATHKGNLTSVFIVVPYQEIEKAGIHNENFGKPFDYNGIPYLIIGHIGGKNFSNFHDIKNHLNKISKNDSINTGLIVDVNSNVKYGQYISGSRVKSYKKIGEEGTIAKDRPLRELIEERTEKINKTEDEIIDDFSFSITFVNGKDEKGNDKVETQIINDKGIPFPQTNTKAGQLMLGIKSYKSKEDGSGQSEVQYVPQLIAPFYTARDKTENAERFLNNIKDQLLQGNLESFNTWLVPTVKVGNESYTGVLTFEKGKFEVTYNDGEKIEIDKNNIEAIFEKGREAEFQKEEEGKPNKPQVSFVVNYSADTLQGKNLKTLIENDLLMTDLAQLNLINSTALISGISIREGNRISDFEYNTNINSDNEGITSTAQMVNREGKYYEYKNGKWYLYAEREENGTLNTNVNQNHQEESNNSITDELYKRRILLLNADEVIEVKTGTKVIRYDKDNGMVLIYEQRGEQEIGQILSQGHSFYNSIDNMYKKEPKELGDKLKESIEKWKQEMNTKPELEMVNNINEDNMPLDGEIEINEGENAPEMNEGEIAPEPIDMQHEEKLEGEPKKENIQENDEKNIPLQSVKHNEPITILDTNWLRKKHNSQENNALDSEDFSKLMDLTITYSSSEVATEFFNRSGNNIGNITYEDIADILDAHGIKTFTSLEDALDILFGCKNK